MDMTQHTSLDNRNMKEKMGICPHMYKSNCLPKCQQNMFLRIFLLMSKHKFIECKDILKRKVLCIHQRSSLEGNRLEFSILVYLECHRCHLDIYVHKFGSDCQHTMKAS